MDIKSLQEKRNGLLKQMEELTKAEFTSETRAKFDTISQDVATLDADINRFAAVEKYNKEQRAAGRPPREVSESGAASDKQAEKRAFADYIRAGARSPELRMAYEQRAITTAVNGGGVGGGAIVPQAFDDVLHEAQLAWGDLINIVRVIRSDDGAPTKYATVNDTSVTWYEETQAVADTNSAEDPAFKQALINTSVIQRPAILVSFAELQDSAFSIDEFMKNTIGKSYFRALSSFVVNGSSSGNIASILGVSSTVTAQGVIPGSTAAVAATATPGKVGYLDLAAVYGKLDPAYLPNAAWAMNSRTRASLIGLTDSLGRPLLTDSETGALDTLLGCPIKLVQAMPDLPTGSGSPPVVTTPILFGDHNEGYTLKLVNPGLNILRLGERYADQLSVGFVPYFRAGGVIVDAGTHPLWGLQVSNA